MATMEVDGARQIDEDRESRQMAVYGRAAMQKMSKSRVLISGMNGIGAETAKNVILANVKEVILHDEPGAKVTRADLGSNFYLTEAHLGKHRAESCRATFQELNPSCSVTAMSEPLTPEFVLKQGLDVVVLADGPLQQAVALDEACRKTVLAEQKQTTSVLGEKKGNAIYGLKETTWTPTTCFIYAAAHGLLGSVFCDFGPEFVVNDTTAEQIKTGIVRSITKGEQSQAEFVIEEDIDFDEGEYAEFAELDGFEGALNSSPEDPKLVKLADVYLGRRLIKVGDLTDLPGEYKSGGILTQRKLPKALSFRSLADCLKDPGQCQDMDHSKQSAKARAFDESVLEFMGKPEWEVKFGRTGLLLLTLKAIDKIGAGAAASADGSEKVLAAAREINAAAAGTPCEVDDLDEERSEVIRRLARGAGAILNPIAAILGGIAGQEVVKACSFKFHPVHQWFCFDAVECLPQTLPPYAPAPDTRYAHQVQVFGSAFQEELAQQNLFLVGSGALGCEFLKNFALMGVGTSGKGGVTVTDDDIIEKSNLSRQFLFRNHNVGKSKSDSAAAAARVMNPEIKINARQDRVAPNTEDVFNDDFWLGTSAVVNALDNVKARLYVDSKCVYYGKALLESGTLGPKCNSQSVIPHFTENYGAHKDPEEKTAPMCALHNFPHNIDMCLGLARSEFVGNFETLPAEVNDYSKAGGHPWSTGLEKAGENKATILDKMIGDPKINCAMKGGLSDALLSERPENFRDCVQWARRKYESYFVDRIRLLVHNFPQDEKTESGKPFWSPPKRFPHAVPFDPSNESAMHFIIAASNLRAKLFGIAEEHRDPKVIAEHLAAVTVPKFEVFKAKLASGEGEEAQADGAAAPAAAAVGDDTDKEIEAAIADLDKALKSQPLKEPLLVNEFEKDDDRNFHVQFVQSFANLRAANYDIPPVDFLQAKLKAGRIIPAIATATATATGFICLELIKVVARLPNSSYRNMYINLALPLFTQSEPQEAKKIKSGSRFDEASYMDVEEVAIPDPQTVWDSIMVPDAKNMTPNGLKEWLKAKYEVEWSSYAMVIPDPERPKEVKADTAPLVGLEDTPWVEIFEKKGMPVGKKSRLEVHNGDSLLLQCEKDDAEIQFARIILQIR
eukprot:Hpha_TRINITY_DN15487_c3_g8::TRINITY_DN15487_c3_g8_i1::g.177388::m.177388/K03178/UBE1, UBA1; ubiquitin-activating enzyme E1